MIYHLHKSFLSAPYLLSTLSLSIRPLSDGQDISALLHSVVVVLMALVQATNDLGDLQLHTCCAMKASKGNTKIWQFVNILEDISRKIYVKIEYDKIMNELDGKGGSFKYF